jgi:CRISPR-associated protein Csy3
VATKLKTASVLAFERKLDISDAFFWQKDSKDDTTSAIPVPIREKSVRGTISNRLKSTIAADPVKLDAEIEKPNLQRVDAAALDDDKDILIVRWSCKALPFDGTPYVCNKPDYQAALLKTVQAYLETQGVQELARRYAANIANARWLWRNRMGAEDITVSVRNGSETITFAQVERIGLNDFTHSSPELEQLSGWLAAGLSGQDFTILYIEAQVRVGYGQEVYPSQELILDTGSRKSKVLYQINGKAGMHSQKIGNAIRTIDTWYGEADEMPFPIAVEPYGSVTTLGMAFRQPKQKKDFYSIFDAWVLDGKAPAPADQHFAMAVLIRGGVFGESGKE